MWPAPGRTAFTRWSESVSQTSDGISSLAHDFPGLGGGLRELIAEEIRWSRTVKVPINPVGLADGNGENVTVQMRKGAVAKQFEPVGRREQGTIGRSLRTWTPIV